MHRFDLKPGTLLFTPNPALFGRNQVFFTPQYVSNQYDALQALLEQARSMRCAVMSAVTLCIQNRC